MATQERKHVLLIDDDTSLLVTLSDFLRFEGYDVTTADSGEQGLKKLEEGIPDLVILDMSMPGMGGVGFLKRISTPGGRPKHPVLVLTARSNMAEFFANVDVDGFVAKPCDPNDLLMEVSRIIFLRGGETEAVERASTRKYKVLIGEDDVAQNKRLVAAFTGAGYLVDTVYRGPEILEKAIVGKPDIVVMKCVLENMNGDAVAELLQQMPNTSSIPVVLYEDVLSASDKTQRITGSVRKVVRRSSDAAVLAAVEDVLAD